MPPYRELQQARDWIRREFIDIPDDHFRITSDPGPYTCIAWAAEDTSRWWWPVFGRYWPLPPVPLLNTVDAFIAAFRTLNYHPCEFDERIEPGYDKVAIYAKFPDSVKHMARQTKDGTWPWTSKLGREYDIGHKSLADIEGVAYGQAVQILKRPEKRRTVSKRSPRTRR